MTTTDIRHLLGDTIVDAWNQEKVTQWLDEKGWGHFASTFEKYHICHDKFFSITLAELVQYLPRTMTTYYERRRLLNEIRSLIPPAPGQPAKPTPSTPTNISINTNVHEYCNAKLEIRLLEGQRVEAGGGGGGGRGCGNSHSLEDEEAATTTTSEGGGFLSDKSPLSSTSSISLPPPAPPPPPNTSIEAIHLSTRHSMDSLDAAVTQTKTTVDHNHYNRCSSSSSITSTDLLSQQYYSHSNPPKSASSLRSSSPSPSPSLSSDHPFVFPFARKQHHQQQQQQPLKTAHSPTRLSPKAAFYKIKDKFHRSHASSTSANALVALSNTHHACQQENMNHKVSLNHYSNNHPISPRLATTGEEEEKDKSARQQRQTLTLSASADDVRHTSTHTTTLSPAFNKDLPTIPARVSSTPNKISKFWATYHGGGNNSSHHNAQHQVKKQQQLYSSGMSKNLYSQYQAKKLTEQKIQITMDLETWYSLNVTNMRDPVIIKKHILQRLNFKGEDDQYLYFHENGPNSDTPMDPQSLMCLCANADHTASQRIFVKPISPDQDSTYHFPTPALGSSPSMIPAFRRKQQQQQQQPYQPPAHRYPHPLLTNTRPLQRHLNRRPGRELSDPSIPVHPYTLPSTSAYHDYPLPSSSYGAYHRKNSDSLLPQQQPPLAELPSAHPTWSRSEPELDHFNRLQLRENVTPPPLSSSAVPSSTSSSSSHGLWAVAPHPHTPVSADASPLKIEHKTAQKSNNELFWGERPPAELVFQHMEHYFDSRDLDKEIVIEEEQQQQSPVVPSPRTQRRQTRKSIRLVAREASRKYNPDYFEDDDYPYQPPSRSSLASLPPSTGNQQLLSSLQPTQLPKTPSPPMLRRKSTKLFGTRVVELKARSAHVIARLPSVSEHMRLVSSSPSSSPSSSSPSTTPADILEPVVQTKPTEVQWIRGKLIGKGSFGRVYLAFNVATGDMIAVKQVEIPKTPSDLLNEQQHDMVEALFQEIMMLRDLDHENIVQYLGYGKDDQEGMINIFLEYVSGGSVASRLALHGAFDDPLTRYFTRQICAGLEYLHSKHILHRDIKAANILVEADGVCKISDFGLSKKNDYEEAYDQNSRMSLRGSVYWMAPEVVKNEPYSAKVDIWSLGCTVLEMLTGQRPWISLNQMAALYNLGKLNSPTIPDHISECAKDFLKQCFIVDPSKRPTAAKLLTHDFLNIDPSFDFKDYVEKGKV